MSRDGLWLKVAGVAALAGFAALLALTNVGCTRVSESAKPDEKWPENKPKVVVSFAPLYCFAANVAGDDATVRNVMTTTGPHDFQPTDTDIKLLSKADIFFTVGLGLDDAPAALMQKGCGNSKLKLIELSKAIPENRLYEGKCHHKDVLEDHKHPIDPHVWLSPDHAVMLVNMIRDELIAIDPDHRDGYTKRAEEYVGKLKKLQADGEALLKDKQNKQLVSFHDSLAYFEKAFKLKVKGVLTPKPGQEPDADQMKKLIEICSNPDSPVRVIAVEPQYSTSNAGEALKKNLEGKVADVVLVEIDTMETVKPDDLKPDWYERKMRANLDALAKALK